jgi:hypothetical protein
MRNLLCKLGLHHYGQWIYSQEVFPTRETAYTSRLRICSKCGWSPSKKGRWCLICKIDLNQWDAIQETNLFLGGAAMDHQVIHLAENPPS